LNYVKELLASRELLGNLVMREVKGQYRRTVFGQLWSLLNPIATMLVYTVVFSFIFRAQPNVGDPSGLSIYPLWLMCGLLPWLYFSRVVNGGLNSMVSNAGLIKKVYFPRMHLPFSVMLSVGITWSIELGVLSLALWIFGGFPIPWLPLVVLVMALLALFSVGVAMMLAILNVHFRDTQHFTTIVLQMWMYLTPIIYPLSLVQSAADGIGSWVLFVYRLNPMQRFVEVFRNFLYDNRLPNPSDVGYILAVTGVVFLLGFWIFSRNEKRLAELL
jgi:ABC-2 type transport system permease protein